MPKKTRKEKILAQARRIVNQSQAAVPANTEPGTPALARTAPYTFSAGHTVSRPATNSPKETTDYPAIRKDLIKTVLLSAAALCIELAIYLKTG